MSAGKFSKVLSEAGSSITVADLDRLPHDARRYELLDGVLVVGPRQTTIHQFAAFQLGKLLDDACLDDLCIVLEPALRPTATTTEFAPDLVVVPVDEVGGAKFTRPPLLVVEIRSPATAIIDLNRKKTAYERFGVPSYWIVDPNPAGPEVTVFELRDRHYVRMAVTTAPVTVERPFPVTIIPAQLTSRLRVAPRQAD